MSKQPFHVLAQHLFNEQITLSEQLIDLLEKENAELRTIQVKELDTIASDKYALISTLNICGGRWQDLMQQRNIESGTKGVETFLGQHDTENESNLLQSWLKSQSLAKQCQRLNAINGTIIILRNQAVQQTLSILRGQLPDNHLYDTKGNQKPTISGGHEIAKA